MAMTFYGTNQRRLLDAYEARAHLTHDQWRTINKFLHWIDRYGICLMSVFDDYLDQNKNIHRILGDVRRDIMEEKDQR